METNEVKILGIVTVPEGSVSTVLNITTVISLLYLLDLFMDINPVKDQYKKMFPAKAAATTHATTPGVSTKAV